MPLDGLSRQEALDRIDEWWRRGSRGRRNKSVWEDEVPGAAARAWRGAGSFQFVDAGHPARFVRTLTRPGNNRVHLIFGTVRIDGGRAVLDSLTIEPGPIDAALLLEVPVGRIIDRVHRQLLEVSDLHAEARTRPPTTHRERALASQSVRKLNRAIEGPRSPGRKPLSDQFFGLFASHVLKEADRLEQRGIRAALVKALATDRHFLAELGEDEGEWLSEGLIGSWTSKARDRGWLAPDSDRYLPGPRYIEWKRGRQ
jgi:hypothetical protein